MEDIQATLDTFVAQSGTPPTRWVPVARANGWRGIPVDSAGGPYEITDGRVRVSPRSPLWPIPAEPQKIGDPPPS